MERTQPKRSRYFTDPDGKLIIVGDSERATIARSFWAKGADGVGASIETAKGLQRAGYNSAAYVWAVRSVEMFFRYCVALCTYYDDGDDAATAFRKAERFVGSGNWSKVWPLVQQFVQEDDPALTDTDEDAWEHWKRHAVGTRDKVVHGALDASEDQAAWVIAYAERIISWVTQRLAVADRGPLRGLLMDIIRAGQEMIRDETNDERSNQPTVFGGSSDDPSTD